MDRLFLVEHNPLFREGLATLLEWQTGLSSVHAGSLAEAKDLLEEANHKPACLIVDLDLPGGEGNELLEQLDGIPVLALIESRSLQRQAEAMMLGAEEMPEQAESWIAEDGIVSRERTLKKVGEQVPNSELSRLAFRRQLVAQCSILVVIAGIVTWLIAA